MCSATKKYIFLEKTKIHTRIFHETLFFLNTVLIKTHTLSVYLYYGRVIIFIKWTRHTVLIISHGHIMHIIQGIFFKIRLVYFINNMI